MSVLVYYIEILIHQECEELKYLITTALLEHNAMFFHLLITIFKLFKTK